MKKKSLIICIALILVIGVFVLLVLNVTKEKGNTKESREQILKKQDNFIHISSEKEIDGYIISSITSNNNKIGIAIFEKENDDNYKFMQKKLTDEEIVYQKFKDYDLFWCNESNLEYAELIYTVNNEEQEPIRINVKDNTVLYNYNTFKEYSVKAIYYDNQGNKYE